MISPFVEKLEKDGGLSYGLSSYGYDARVSKNFKIFTNVNSATVDPKKFSDTSFVDREVDYCIIQTFKNSVSKTQTELLGQNHLKDNNKEQNI